MVSCVNDGIIASYLFCINTMQFYANVGCTKYVFTFSVWSDWIIQVLKLGSLYQYNAILRKCRVHKVCLLHWIFEMIDLWKLVFLCQWWNYCIIFILYQYNAILRKCRVHKVCVYVQGLNLTQIICVKLRICKASLTSSDWIIQVLSLVLCINTMQFYANVGCTKYVFYIEYLKWLIYGS